MPLRVSVKEFTERFALTVPKRSGAATTTKLRLLDINQILAPLDTRGMKLTQEQALSAQLYARLVQLHHAGQLRCTFTCVPNEIPLPTWTDQLRKMAAMIGMKRRAMGCLPGAPDYVFCWATGSGWIELKVPGGEKVLRKVQRVGYEKLHPVKVPPGRLSDEQVAFQAWCGDTAVNHAVCHTVEQALAKLREWGAVVAGEHAGADLG